MLAVTGSTGKSGSIFLQELVEHASEVTQMFTGGVRLLVRSKQKLQTMNPKAVEVLHPDLAQGELTDEAYLSKALEGVDTLVHIAGIHWSREVVRAAVKNHVRRLVFVHTTGIYSKYKAAGEEYRQIDAYVKEKCKQNQIKLTILRPTMIYGRTDDHNVCVFITMVDKLPIMPVVNGAHYKLQPVSYIDLGRAYWDVLTNEKVTTGKEYNLSGGNEIELRDMLTEIGKQLGKQVSFVSCPYTIAYAGAWMLYIISIGNIDFRERVQRLCEPRVYSHKAATVDFGYHPCDFAEGVTAEIKTYKDGQ